MNRFYFGGSDESGSDLDDSLPYPKPLARSAFLTPDFDPTTFLSSLNNRHQTLEDLRSELRTRSQELNKELLNLVNENYQDFLSVGSSLQGGEEKVEEVRIGLLGFRGDLEMLKSKVSSRKSEVGKLIEERRRTQIELQKGRTLLEIDDSLEDLEKDLLVVPNGQTSMVTNDNDFDFSGTEDDSEEEGLGSSMVISRLQRHVHRFLYIKKLTERVGANHPFLTQQGERVRRLEQTLILDLNSVLTQHSPSSDTEKGRILKIAGMYRDLGHGAEALKTVTNLKVVSA